MRNIAISLSRVAVGLGLALIVGIPCGLLMGCSAASERLAMPALQFLRMISPLSWMPVAALVDARRRDAAGDRRSADLVLA